MHVITCWRGHGRRPRARTLRAAWDGFFDDPVLLDDPLDGDDQAAEVPHAA